MIPEYRVAAVYTIDGRVVDRTPDPVGRRYFRASAAVKAARDANEWRKPVFQLLNDSDRALGRTPVFPDVRWYAYDARTGRELS